jgi:hypothetical protein
MNEGSSDLLAQTHTKTVTESWLAELGAIACQQVLHVLTFWFLPIPILKPVSSMLQQFLG